MPGPVLLVAIETSGSVGSVAAAVDGVVVAEESFERGMRHGREVVPRLATVCARLGPPFTGPRSIGVVAVSVGPGSYTGVRVGVTCAKTLAFATGAALVPVRTLEVLAQNGDAATRHVAALVDARRGKVYAALFERRSGALVRLTDDAVLEPRAALAALPAGTLVVGDAAERFAAIEEAAGAGAIRLAPPDSAIAQARQVALLGWREFLAGRAVPPHDLVPVYLRVSAAEERLRAREAAAKPPG